MTAYVPQEVEAAGKTCDLSGVLDIRECLMEEEINSKKRLKLLRCTGRTSESQLHRLLLIIGDRNYCVLPKEMPSKMVFSSSHTEKDLRQCSV
jgi:hypothetical protein